MLHFLVTPKRHRWLLGWALGSCLGAVALAAEPAKPPPTPAQLAQWAKELDHDAFLVREEATLQLVRAGLPAVDLCRQVLQKPSAEAGSRALHVLHQLALSNNVDQLDAARTALEEVTRGKTSPLKFRAEEVLAQLNSERQAITLGELEALGAKIRRSQISNGFAIEEVVQSLEIGNEWRGTEQDFKRLRWLADVRQVALVGNQVTDAILPHLVKMKGLKSVQVYRADISDEGCKLLAGCDQLEDIGLYYIPIGDEALKALQQLRALTSVRVYGTRATPAVAAQLQAGLGAGKVDFRQGAFLGVGCITVDQNCAISRVSPGSPAEKAGVKQDDIVLGFNGQPVPDFETLTALISKLQAGDVATLEVQRITLADDGRPVHKKHTIKATLAEWPVDQFIIGATRE